MLIFMVGRRAQEEAGIGRRKRKLLKNLNKISDALHSEPPVERSKNC